MSASQHIRHTAKLVGLALAVTLSGCNEHPQSIGEHVVYQDRLVEVPRPCPVKKPARPGDAKTHGLARPLPTDPGALVDVLLAKLKEWDGPGKYGDQADAAITTCTKP
jgi:hypothetical protein